MRTFLTNKSDNTIVVIGSVERGIFKDVTPKEELFCVTDSKKNKTYYSVKGFNSCEATSIPRTVSVGYEWCYTSDKGFYKNPDYKDPSEETETETENKSTSTDNSQIEES